MAGVRCAPYSSLCLALLLLSGAARSTGAQQACDAHLSITATVIASAARVDHAEVSALSSRPSGINEREVRLVVTAGSATESILSLVPRVSGVTIEIVRADGRTTPIGSDGVRVARASGGSSVSVPLLLRLHSAEPELLLAASAAPVSLQVDSASR